MNSVRDIMRQQVLEVLRSERLMKYRPEFPKTFSSIKDARAFCADLFGCTTGVMSATPG